MLTVVECKYMCTYFYLYKWNKNINKLSFFAVNWSLMLFCRYDKIKMIIKGNNWLSCMFILIIFILAFIYFKFLFFKFSIILKFLFIKIINQKKFLNHHLKYLLYFLFLEFFMYNYFSILNSTK